MVIDMTMNNELCEKLANAAYEKSQELGIEISFAICDLTDFLECKEDLMMH